MRNASLLHAVCKRCLDIVFAFIGLILLSPVFLTISVFYLFGENRGPLIFKQKRVGKNGELFYIYKFRSMIVDADKKLKANKLLYQKYLKNNYKLEPNEDPRITKLGQFLRKTSLDEIPQLINVIKGNMSLVGPRPIVEEELKEYGEKRGLLLSVKPGVTGYWQVNGRSNVGYPERVELELYYVYNCSLILDIKILLLTIKNVILKKGAY
ncbi:sugar transferase [Heyndrickxia coagulans]|uniref:sugar transferase n=1 Tax=Heyndrickxia coagulans TaxID=1398 RepID=UPI00399D4F33